MTTLKRKRVKIQKQSNETNFLEEVEEKTSARKAPRTRSRKEVIKKPVTVGRKAREKEVKEKQIVVNVNVSNDEIPKTRGKGTRLKRNNIQKETFYSDSSSELIAHKKPYYGGRKKLPQRAATTQKIDYSVNHYYHEFQDFFYTRLDDDDNDEPKRKKSLSMPARERSSDNDYFDISSQDDEKNLKSTPKRIRRKKLPQRGSKEKNIDYSENTYYRKFDSAMNARFWSDKLSNDEKDASDTEIRSNNYKKTQISSAIPSTPTSNKLS
ncbi:6805_t:CDS:2 [Funneliformis caledonium]|uniref:6805_t:CDS:1 n=1 Tax=Funneliformis caledonium TaxID=1117310 RepID=A0A9N8WIX8_9GLOM|nr:6805_t:CDS:2 [Funneliformis caledonium]